MRLCKWSEFRRMMILDTRNLLDKGVDAMSYCSRRTFVISGRHLDLFVWIDSLVTRICALASWSHMMTDERKARVGTRARSTWESVLCVQVSTHCTLPPRHVLVFAVHPFRMLCPSAPAQLKTVHNSGLVVGRAAGELRLEVCNISRSTTKIFEPNCSPRLKSL